MRKSCYLRRGCWKRMECWQGPYFLGAIALEEMGKVPMLARSIWFTQPKEWERFWKRFRSHFQKDLNFELLAPLLRGDEVIEKLANEGGGDKQVKFARAFDFVKQTSLYVEHIGGFVTPSELFSKYVPQTGLLKMGESL